MHGMVASSDPYASSAIRASTNATLTALAAAYLQPWAAGITQRQLDDAHLHWADYRDPQWGGYLPPPTSINRLLRLTILSGRLHYVNSASSRSSRRLARQRVALRLVQRALDAHGLPDLDLVLSLADRPTVPRRLATRRPPPVFAYARTHAHLAIPFPPLSFDPLRWPRLHAALSRRPPLARRERKAIWRGACNSLCDMMRGRRCSPLTDLALLDRYALLRAAERCPHLADVAITAPHRNCPGVRVLPPVPMAEHARYAFLLHVDGNGFSGRLDELFSLGGAILKQDSPFEAFYYPLLRRGVHFAPLHRNLSNLCHEVHRLSAQCVVSKQKVLGEGVEYMFCFYGCRRRVAPRRQRGGAAHRLRGRRLQRGVLVPRRSDGVPRHPPPAVRRAAAVPAATACRRRAVAAGAKPADDWPTERAGRGRQLWAQRLVLPAASEGLSCASGCREHMRQHFNQVASKQATTERDEQLLDA